MCLQSQVIKDFNYFDPWPFCYVLIQGGIEYSHC